MTVVALSTTWDDSGAGRTSSVTTSRGALRYQVTSVTTYRKQTLAGHAARFFDQGVPGRLVLITCEDWNGKVYLSNVVVIGPPDGVACSVVTIDRLDDDGVDGGGVHGSGRNTPDVSFDELLATMPDSLREVFPPTRWELQQTLGPRPARGTGRGGRPALDVRLAAVAAERRALQSHPEPGHRDPDELPRTTNA